MKTIKPFYIKMTSDITTQQAQDALDKCVSMGVAAEECFLNVETTIEYKERLNDSYSYFGVTKIDEELFTYLHGNTKLFSPDAIEITLDQLDEHLGIKKETSWNGEGYPPIGIECEVSNCRNPWVRCLVKFIGTELCVVDHENFEQHYHLSSVKFRPLETPGQKKEREELEAAYDLYKTKNEGHQGLYSFDEFQELEDVKGYIRLVRKTNYKLEKPQ